MRSAQVLADHPGRAFSAVMQGEQALGKGYYRMLDQPDDSAVTMDSVSMWAVLVTEGMRRRASRRS